MMGGGGTIIGLLFFLVVLAALVVAIVALVWWVNSQRMGAAGPSAQAKPADQATTILRERYARGEIDKAEYEQRLKDLSG
jgi:putative membrane protein